MGVKLVSYIKGKALDAGVDFWALEGRRNRILEKTA